MSVTADLPQSGSLTNSSGYSHQIISRHWSLPRPTHPQSAVGRLLPWPNTSLSSNSSAATNVTRHSSNSSNISNILDQLETLSVNSVGYETCVWKDLESRQLTRVNQVGEFYEVNELIWLFLIMIIIDYFHCIFINVWFLFLFGFWGSFRSEAAEWMNNNEYSNNHNDNDKNDEYNSNWIVNWYGQVEKRGFRHTSNWTAVTSSFLNYFYVHRLNKINHQANYISK